MTEDRDALREALARLVKAWDNGVSSDPSAWKALDREIDAALAQARAALLPEPSPEPRDPLPAEQMWPLIREVDDLLAAYGYRLVKEPSDG